MELQKLRVNEILYKRKINILDKKLELERHGHFVVYKVVREKLESRDKELKGVPIQSQGSRGVPI